MPGWGRPRSVATHGFPEVGIPRIGPQLAPSFEIIGRNHLLAAALLNGKGSSSCDHKGSISAAYGLLPKLWKTFRWPGGEDVHLVIGAISLRPSKISPIGTLRLCGWLQFCFGTGSWKSRSRFRLDRFRNAGRGRRRDVFRNRRAEGQLSMFRAIPFQIGVMCLSTFHKREPWHPTAVPFQSKPCKLV